MLQTDMTVRPSLFFPDTCITSKKLKQRDGYEEGYPEADFTS